MGADAYDLTIGNNVEVSEGLRKGENLGEAVEGANIGRDAVGALRSWTPGGNIWFLRAGSNRSVLDQLQRIVDPEAEEDFARRRKLHRAGAVVAAGRANARASARTGEVAQ